MYNESDVSNDHDNDDNNDDDNGNSTDNRNFIIIETHFDAKLKIKLGSDCNSGFILMHKTEMLSAIKEEFHNASICIKFAVKLVMFCWW